MRPLSKKNAGEGLDSMNQNLTFNEVTHLNLAVAWSLDTCYYGRPQEGIAVVSLITT